jgi:hypothetical protein
MNRLDDEARSKSSGRKQMDTSEIMRRFNQAFLEHNPALLRDLIAPD